MTPRAFHPASWVDRLALLAAGTGLGAAMLLAAQVFHD